MSNYINLLANNLRDPDFIELYAKAISYDAMIKTLKSFPQFEDTVKLFEDNFNKMVEDAKLKVVIHDVMKGLPDEC